MSEPIVGKTAICTVGEGHDLTYRGYRIEDLSQKCSFEEVAYLLLHGALPDQAALYLFQQAWLKQTSLTDAYKRILETLPGNAHPMDVLRTLCSTLGSVESEKEWGNEAELAVRAIGVSISGLWYWHHWHVNGKRIELGANSGSMAEYTLALYHQKNTIDPQWAWALNIALILYAEHEFNASTYAARVTASTESDFHSGIVSAIGTLKGPLHGGANEAAMALLEEFSTPEQAQKGLLKKLEQKQKIMGFGHRVYKNGDPRSPIIKAVAQELTNKMNKGNLFAIAEAIENTMVREKGLKTNLDFYSAIVFHCIGIPTPYFTPLFVFSRITGWAAHIVEQRQAKRLIRPLAEYVGPAEKAFVPITER